MSSTGGRAAAMGKRLHRARIERELALFREPETLSNICDSVSAAGTISQFCKLHDVRFNAVLEWLQSDETRATRYAQALESRKVAIQDKVLEGAISIADQDPRKLFDDNGAAIPVQDIPEELARNLTSIKTTPVVISDKDGKHVRTEHVVDEVKLISRQTGLEMLGKLAGAFAPDKVELSGAGGGPIQLAAITANLCNLETEELRALISIMGKLSAPAAPKLPPNVKALPLKRNTG